MNRQESSPSIAMLFDLDGVLIDSERSYTLFWSEMDRKFPTGISNFSTRIKGMTLTEIYNEYFPNPAIQSKITQLLNEYELTMQYDILPGVITLLRELKRLKIPAIMVTSSNDKKMQSLWRQHPELRQYFLHIITADRISHSKPNPEGYLLGASIAGVNPRNCAVFEDSVQGVKAGHNADAYVVGIAGTLPAADIAPYCDSVVDSLQNFNLPQLISTLEKRV